MKLSAAKVICFCFFFDGNALFLPLDNVEKSKQILNNEHLPYVRADFDLPFNVVENRLKDEFLSVIRR